MPDLFLEFETLEPVTLSAETVVSNEVGTANYLTATALRGSCFQFLRQHGRAADAEAWLGLAGPLWSPGWPVKDSRHWTIPSPRAFLRDKLHPGLTGGLRNSLFPEQPPQGAPPGEVAAAKVQWTRLGVRWLAVDRETAAIHGAVQTKLESSMHAGLHYGRQSHRTGALHSREAICPGSRFLAWVRNAPSILPDGEWVIGNRRSPGNGLMRVTVTEGQPPAWLEPAAKDFSNEVVVQLLSDAVVPGPSGGKLRGLDSAAWTKIVGAGEVTVRGAASSSRAMSQWSTAWGYPREQEAVIESGSCWRITSQDPAFGGRLEALVQNGIGLRRHEGFGRIAVDPPWLQLGADGGVFQCGTASAEGIPLRGPLPWPGLDGIAVERLTEIVAASRSAAQGLSDDASRSVSQLENYAGRAADQAQVLRYLQSMANRANPGPWKQLASALEQDIQSIPDLRPLQFYLLCLANEVTFRHEANPGGGHARNAS